MRASVACVVLWACGEAPPCPSLPAAHPIRLGAAETHTIQALPGWTATASVTGPFAWDPDEFALHWKGEGYGEGALTLVHRDPSSACPEGRVTHSVRASSFSEARLRWVDTHLDKEVPARTGIGFELHLRNEGWTGTWVPPARWTGRGARVDGGQATWVPPLSNVVLFLDLVAEGGPFEGRLEWDGVLPGLDWEGQGIEPRLVASDRLDFGVLLVGAFDRRSVALRAENVPVDIVHVEGPAVGPFHWSAPTRVEEHAELSVRFAPAEVGDWSERLRIWWRGRDRIEVHEVLLEAKARSCEALCQLPEATTSCVGGCRIESCHPGWWDANGQASDGCECRDVEDPSDDCARARPLPEIRDDQARIMVEGILAGPADVDVLRVIAADGSNIFGDSFDVRLALFSESPLELCVRRAPGRWPRGTCPGSDWSCGPRHRFEGRHFQDDTQTLWLRIRSTTQSCAPYQVELSNG
ncbi:MAG: hypothetical protein AAGD10_04055 [Myxococcota bacterium]